MVKKKWSRHWRHGGESTPQYWCPICKKAHTKHSEIGKKHTLFERKR